MSTLPARPVITVDGNLSDWIASERIDYNDVNGYTLYSQAQGDYFYDALSTPLVIGANTTVWFNTDLDAASGYQILGLVGGAEYNLNIRADGTAALYTGAAGQIPCARQHPDGLLRGSSLDRVRHPEARARQS